MSKLLAIDYGQKRVGIAVTDDEQLIASGLTTVHSKDIFSFLKEYLNKEVVSCFVVGQAKNLDNTPSESARFIEPFVSKLKKEFPSIDIHRIDERFSSKIAFQSMIDAGLKKKTRRNKALVDQVSATIILQSYLDSRK
jgi:putative Holliday junction resolvase